MSQPIVQTHSMQATRTRPWQMWREPLTGDEARYFDIQVNVVERLGQLALIDYAGRRMVVETLDLTPLTESEPQAQRVSKHSRIFTRPDGTAFLSGGGVK